MSLTRNTLVQAGLTFGSRILGFGRDLALAYRFGQSPAMDVFSTAIMLPNLFRRLFAEGAFSQAFVPVYGRIRTQHGDEEAAGSASEAMSFMLLVVAVTCIVLQLCAPVYMPLLLSAYRDDPEILALAEAAVQLAMPYLAFMTLASLLSGVLNSAERFALSAGVPALLNACTLVALSAPSFTGNLGQGDLVLITSAAVAFSGTLQVAVLWWGVRRLGVEVGFRWPAATPTVKRILVLAVPGAIAGGAMQISSLVSQILSGSDAGARSVLYYADRLYQLPLSLVGVAIGLALVPRLTRAFVSSDHDEGRRTLDEGLTLAMVFALPAAVALLALPFVIIDATTTRGAFTTQDAVRTADVLRQFAWGVPAFILVKVLTPPFFAREDTRRPMMFAIASVGVTVSMGTALFIWLSEIGSDGVMGLAIATSLSAWFNVGLLVSALARERVWRPGRDFLIRLSKVMASSAVMGAALILCSINYAWLSEVFGYKEVAVVVICGLGGLIYGSTVILFGGVTMIELWQVLKRDSPPGRDS
jgi:putative peptidoglycan lipid II flippase